MSESGRPVEPVEYTKEYFLTDCDGYAEYVAGGGKVLALRLQALWRLLRLRPGMNVLDVGCGRGEIAVHCGLGGVQAIGIDYSEAGLRLAQRTIKQVSDLDQDGWKRPFLAMGNARRLPFRDNSFDRAVMSDIVEHLYPWELSIALAEVYRVLVPSGELLIHTMPNLWYYRYGYPLFRLVQRLRNVPLPTDPRDRLHYPHLHVNEQSPRTLHGALAASPFSNWRLFLRDYRVYRQYNALMRFSMRVLTGTPLVKLVFCDDIFVLARK